MFILRELCLRTSLYVPSATKMFQFAEFPQLKLISCRKAGTWLKCSQLRLGFPIRKSPAIALLASLPRLIAGSYVLHRLLTPRHPSSALINLKRPSLRKLFESFLFRYQFPLIDSTLFTMSMCCPRSLEVAISLRESAAGGPERGRTADLLVANEALYRLSYGPAD